MAKNKQEAAPKKRRWYQTFGDAYKAVKRTFPWITAALILAPILIIALAVLAGVLWGNLVLLIITGVMLAVLADMSMLAFLIRPAVYRQVEGRVGSVYSVISQIRRGWTVEEEPVAANKSQDLVWRIVGRPGVVLITEGPTARVAPLVSAEKRKILRTVANVPIVVINVGQDEGQVRLPKLNRELRKQKKQLTKHEVPAVANRLNALGNRGPAIPKGVDPTKARGMSRRALRG